MRDFEVAREGVNRDATPGLLQIGQGMPHLEREMLQSAAVLRGARSALQHARERGLEFVCWQGGVRAPVETEERIYDG